MVSIASLVNYLLFAFCIVNISIDQLLAPFDEVYVDSEIKESTKLGILVNFRCIEIDTNTY